MLILVANYYRLLHFNFLCLLKFSVDFIRIDQKYPYDCYFIFQTFDIAQGTSRIINRLVAPTANNCGKLLIARSNDIQISDLGEVTNQCAAGVHFSAKTARPPKNRVPARISAPDEIMIPKPKLLALSTYFAAILVCIPFKIF